MEISFLPEELLETIFSYLSVISDLCLASKVCRQWRKICLEVHRFKIDTFYKESRKGSFIWRICDEKTSVRQNIPLNRRGLKSLSRGSLSKPYPRIMHGAVFHGETLYVYGGKSSDEASFFNDMYAYDVHAQKWEKLQPVNPAPTPRSSFSSVIYEDSIFISGGCISSRTSIRFTEQVFDDVYCYNVLRKTWNKCGTMKTRMFDHQSTILKGKKALKLVHLGGNPLQAHHGVTKIEISTISVDDNGDYIINGSDVKEFPVLLIRHGQCKINEHNILVYGGVSMLQDEPTKFFIRNEAWLLKFHESHDNVDIIRVEINDLKVYDGLYPCVSNDFVHIKDFLVCFQRSCFVKESLAHPGLLEVDSDRKPTGDAVYRQDYYHTFILDIQEVLSTLKISWLFVNNPPLMAPRNSIFHRTILAGDSIYLFGGSIHDRRTKLPIDSNNLYKINVLRRLEE